MALDIEGYTYITHKLINRPWGPEVRFTVAKPDGTHINEVLPIPSEKITDEELTKIIIDALKKIDVVIEPPPDPMDLMIKLAVEQKEAEIKNILVAKELMTSEQEITDIKTKAEIIASSADTEVKP